MNMRSSRTGQLCEGAVIAALYVALTYVSAVLGLSSGAVQIRLGEVLCILPVFLPSAVPGLTIGCLLANLLTGSAALDVVFGPVATLLGALGTRLLRTYPGLRLLPPILSNAVIVPWVLRFGYGAPDAIWFMALTVAGGEIIAAGVLGGILLRALRSRTRLPD